ncbi:MAG: hypothetical protein HQL37_15790, partial [Alphaproteobacteria bacterium]|nr:hypothetical protein [Alphaproteobacteria bacterium]
GIAETEASLATTDCNQARADLEALMIDDQLIRLGKEIEVLSHGKGSTDKSLDDLPRRRTELTIRTGRMNDLQRELGWPENTAQAVKVMLPRGLMIVEARRLLEERSALEATLAAAATDETAGRQTLETLQQQFGNLPADRDYGQL